MSRFIDGMETGLTRNQIFVSSFSESRKRDFVSQLILTMEQKSSEFIAAGYVPTSKIDELKQQSAAADAAEVVQQAAKAAAKDATVAAKETL